MLLLYITVVFMPHILGFPRKIPIGGLFDGDEMIQKAFERSIKAINKKISVTEHARGVSLAPRIGKVNKNAFQVANIACKLINNGVAGIFGPQNRSAAGYVQSMCDTLDIPCIAARWDSELTHENVINLHPHPDELSKVFQNLIKEYKWEKYAVLYDNMDSLTRISHLLKLPNMNNISAMVFHLGSGPNFRQTMKEVKFSGYRNIVIDCSYDILENVLKQAQQVGIMSEQYTVIIASLDLQTLDLEPYQYSGVNLTGVRLIDPESSIVQHTLQSWPLRWNLTDGSHLRVEAALAYDAIQLFASGYARLHDSGNLGGNLKKLSCNSTESWGHGVSLSNYMRNEQIHGLSGMIRFDTAGFRSEFQLDIVNLGSKGLYKIGKWKTNTGIEWQPSYKISGVDDKTSLRDEHFRVLFSLVCPNISTAPFGMIRESISEMTGNDRYEGYGMDIIQEMSKILKFNYTFEVHDDNYGSFNNVTKKWTGMLGKIIAHEADLAITDLTITADREEAVDFTSPFMNLGISVLYRTPTKAPPSLLSFLLPFSKDVWVHLIGAYIVVSALLFVIGKLSPVEWTNPYPCIKEPEVLKTPYTLPDTPFLVIGAILKGPTGFAPAGISTRTLAVAWWFFTLIMGATYVANLAAALSTKSVVWNFKKAEDLAYQTKIAYGAKINGSTLSFFRGSSYEPYKIMYEYMTTHPGVLMKKNEDALSKVQHEDYAFLMESSSIEYIKQRNCNVTQIGELLDSKSYGIAMRKNEPYRTDLTGAILQLQESGVLGQLYTKWWKQRRGGDICDAKESAVSADPLNFEDVGGVFLIMISGVALSWIFAAWSFLWNIRNIAIRHDVSFKKELIEELKFLIKCSSKKTVRRRTESLETIESNSTGTE